jgi:hypothetical protein
MQAISLRTMKLVPQIVPLLTAHQHDRVCHHDSDPNNNALPLKRFATTHARPFVGHKWRMFFLATVGSHN